MTHQRTLPTREQKVDRLPALAEQSNQAATEYPDTYAAAVMLAIAWDTAGDTGADAALYVGRETLRHPDADAGTVAAFAVKSARQYAAATYKAERATYAATIGQPFSLDDSDLALDDAASIDLDPANLYNWSPLALVEECEPAAVAALRTPGQVGQALALTRAQAAARTSASWYRAGWSITTKKTSPMTPQPAPPTSGPASAVCTWDQEGHLAAVDGLPADEARALLGLPQEASDTATADAAHATLTHATREADPRTGTKGAAATWAKILKEEANEDTRREAMRKPIQKLNTRKRPKGGRIGTPSTIR